jgi:hypothetical protein
MAPPALFFPPRFPFVRAVPSMAKTAALRRATVSPDGGRKPPGTEIRARSRDPRIGRLSMLNRSAVVIGHEPAFYGWLKTTGLTDDHIRVRTEAGDRSVYLIPSCQFPEEIDEVVEDLFEEIFRRELASWLPDIQDWPDTADFDLFTRWFTVDGVSAVIDVGRGEIAVEP